MTWQRYRNPALAILIFVIVIWVALTVTAPDSPPGPTPEPSRSTVAIDPECPSSAPNAAAGCLIGSTP